MKRIILASNSPRRSEILALLGLKFDIIVKDTDETVPEGLHPAEVVCMLAERKARAVAQDFPDSVVIGADTVVHLLSEGESTILGKPKDRADAVRMLMSMSGKKHLVFTGVSVVSDGEARTLCGATRVYFRPFTEAEAEAYAATGECDDKAGAYGIQGLGSLLIARIEGDYFNVVGLPKRLTAELLSRAGIDVFEINKQK